MTAQTPDEQRKQVTLDHVAEQVRRTRRAYLLALDDALQLVIDEATTPTRRGQLAPDAGFLALPGETIASRLDRDGHLTTWEAGATDAQNRRLNRADLRQAAERLGLLDALPELREGRPV